jgi:hypothetical protein
MTFGLRLGNKDPTEQARRMDTFEPAPTAVALLR